MAIDWGGRAATSGATGDAEMQRQTAAGRQKQREHLKAMAKWYRQRGDEAEARNYDRQARALAP